METVFLDIWDSNVLCHGFQNFLLFHSLIIYLYWNCTIIVHYLFHSLIIYLYCSLFVPLFDNLSVLKLHNYCSLFEWSKGNSKFIECTECATNCKHTDAISILLLITQLKYSLKKTGQLKHKWFVLVDIRCFESHLKKTVK